MKYTFTNNHESKILLRITALVIIMQALLMGGILGYFIHSAAGIIIIAVSAMVLAAIYLSLGDARHEITETHLILRQGIFGGMIIPLEDIASARIYEEPLGMMGIGMQLSFSRPRVYMVTASHDIIEVKLKKPSKAKLLHIISRGATEVYFNIDDHFGFLRELKGKMQDKE